MDLTYIGAILVICVIFALLLESIGKILVYMLSAGFVLIAIYMFFSTEGNLAAEVFKLVALIKVFIFENLKELIRSLQNLIKIMLSGA